MSEPTMSWADLLAWSDGHGLLAKRLYVVLSEPVTGLQAVLDNLDAHVAHQTRLENEGIMFAAGPLSDDAEQEWHGDGLLSVVVTMVGWVISTLPG
jgi:uncharacterized protein